MANNTYLERLSETSIGLRLHSTHVLTFDPFATTYNTGGWYTVTTKDRMNSYGPAMVYSEHGTWYMFRRYPDTDWHDREPYFDGIRVSDDGHALNPKPQAEQAKIERERKAMLGRISAYCREVKAAYPVAPCA